MKEKYGTRVSAAKLSRDLHLQSGGQFYASPETVRKWLLGVSKPRYDAIVALESLLACRIVVLLPSPHPSPPPPSFRKGLKHAKSGL